MKSMLIVSALLLSSQAQAFCPGDTVELYSGPEVSAYCYAAGPAAPLAWLNATLVCLAGSSTLVFEADGRGGQQLVGSCADTLEIRY